MSDDHEHGSDPPSAVPAAESHDPRLESSGEDHPGVQPRPFDLIALENTRLGLRILGLGLAAWSIARPLNDLLRLGHWKVHAIVGLCLTALAMVSLIAALSILAPTPHGPLPRVVKAGLAFLCLAALLACGVDLYVVFGERVPERSTLIALIAIDLATRAVCLGLPWILWRFCQNRGLSGRAIVWLWIAMASTAIGVCYILPLYPGMGIWPTVATWGFIPLGVITFFAAQQTARDVWLDAVYRNTKFHAVNRSDAIVEPLHPANER